MRKMLGFLLTVAGGCIIGSKIAEEVTYRGLRTAVDSAMESAFEAAKSNINNWIMKEGGVDVSAPIPFVKAFLNLTYNKNINIMYTNI